MRVTGPSEAIHGNVWFFCASLVQVAPNVRVSWSTFTANSSVYSGPNRAPEGAMIMRTMGIANAERSDAEGSESTGYVAAGKDGATLRREALSLS